MMNEELQRGDIVTAFAYGGRVLTRRVWQAVGRGVVLCSEDDYQRAITDGIEPRAVGFPREDVRRQTGCGACEDGWGNTEDHACALGENGGLGPAPAPAPREAEDGD